MVMNMSLSRSNEFINEVISYIKFPFDRDDIEEELRHHIQDKMEYYHSEGMDHQTAEELTLKDMGDPKEIGIALSKEHNPILGWIYAISKGILYVNLGFFASSLIMWSLAFIFSIGPVYDIPKENIVYNIEMDEKVQIDDRVINFTNVIYEKNGDMTIVYEYNQGELFGGGWPLYSIGIVKDNLGNDYSFVGSGGSVGLLTTKGVSTVSDFPEEADTLIIEYDRFNRYYKLEVPLKAGESNE